MTDRRKYSRESGRQVVENNLGIQGQDKLTEIVNAIQPVHEVRAIRDWEYFYENVVPFSFAQFQAAVVGERSMVALVLAAALAPPGSFLYVKGNAWPNAGGGSLWKLSTENEIAATLAITGTRIVARDNRVQSPNPTYQGPGQCIVPYFGSDPTFVGDNTIEVGLAGVRAFFDDAWVIVRPGFGVIVEGDTNNVGLGASFHGLAFGMLGG